MAISERVAPGAPVVLMARVASPSGTILTPALVSSITATIRDESVGTAQPLPIAVNGAVLPSLVAWPNNEPDLTGYNFTYTLAASYLATPGRFYFVVFSLFLVDGTTTTLEYEISVEAVRPVYDQTDDLAVTYPQLLASVANYLGWTVNHQEWTAEEQARLNELVRRGLWQFYWPPAQQDGSVVRWSFLSPQASISATSGTAAYDLPNDFGGNLRDVTFTAASGNAPLTPISDQHMRALQAANTQNGKPSYYTARPRSSTGATDQAWEVVLYPTPDATYSLLCRYDVVPPALTESNPVPLGGPIHSKTILESCLAAAEIWQNDTAAVHQQLFASYLGASIKADASMVQGDVKDTWPVGGAPSMTLDLTYADLQRHVGQFLDIGWDSSRWTRDQLAVVDDLIQAGLRQFYRPPVLEGQQSPHQWSFLVARSDLALAASTSTYNLPTDFSGQLIGGLTYSAGARQVPIVHITDQKLRELAAHDNASGPPQYVSLRPLTATGAARQGWSAVFYPIPVDSYTITVQYITIPPRLTNSNPFPLGGVDHAETILASCLAAAEKRLKPSQAVFQGQFKERLAASILADTKEGRTEAVWEVADADPMGLDVTYSLLLKRVGAIFKLGWDVGGWTTEERKRVEMAIHDGLRQFYSPPPIGRERFGHEWSFLRPIATLTTTANVSTVALPADFAAFDGPLTFAPGVTALYHPIEIVAEHQVRSRLSAVVGASRPTIAAVRPVRSDQTGAQSWELLFHPTPDAAYTLTYRYRVNMQPLSDAAPYPPGGQMHGQTILESCLSAAEAMNGVVAGPHSSKFIERLVASVSADRKASSPEFLGYNGDQSDRPTMDAPCHSWSSNWVMYNGKVGD